MMGAQGHSYTVYRGSKSGEIEEATTTHGPLQGDEVLVAVTASGVCGTDLHYRTTDMALGHEGAGVVKEVGPGVRRLKVGDRVGWGYLHESCGQCQQCLSGRETYCPERKLYAFSDLDQGSFAQAAVWREAYLFSLPEQLSDEDAAPLMCGGATVFNALYMYDAKPTDRVGIVGVGGLGHLAIQFASKMGCDTVVFSGTDSKKEEAMKLGATEFFATKGIKQLDIGRKIDVLLVTTSALPDWDLYIPNLAPQAKIIPLSVDSGDMKFPYEPLVGSGLTIQGSVVAPRYIHRLMLDFAARHGIKPMINKFELNKKGIDEAIQTLNAGKMRYRGVLVQSRENRL